MWPVSTSSCLPEALLLQECRPHSLLGLPLNMLQILVGAHDILQVLQQACVVWAHGLGLHQGDLLNLPLHREGCELQGICGSYQYAHLMHASSCGTLELGLHHRNLHNIPLHKAVVNSDKGCWWAH